MVLTTWAQPPFNSSKCARVASKCVCARASVCVCVCVSVRACVRAGSLSRLFGVAKIKKKYLCSIANVYTAQGKLAEALELYYKSLAIREHKLGCSDPLVADIKQKYAFFTTSRSMPTANAEALRRSERAQRCVSSRPF